MITVSISQFQIHELKCMFPWSLPALVPLHSHSHPSNHPPPWSSYPLALDASIAIRFDLWLWSCGRAGRGAGLTRLVGLVSVIEP